MLFDSEAEMKDTAKKSLKQSFGSNALEIVPEFDYGSGRTDIVLVNVSDAYWSRRVNRLNLATPIQKKADLQTFLQLHGRGEITKDYFHQIGALPRRQKRKSLRWLISNGFVEQKNDKIRTANNLRKHITTAIGIELKLRKWKDALQQAHRGRAFADYRYVALDKDHVGSALDNLEMFEERRVGLLSIDGDGHCKKHFEPPRGNPFSHLHRWNLNEWSLSQRLRSNKSAHSF